MDGEKIFVFTESITEDRQIFTKYFVQDDIDISIGRNENNDVCYANKFVSSKHVSLLFKSGKCFVEDYNSANGVFVNGKRVTQKELNIGDTILLQ